MKENLTYSFISPIHGRILCDYNYVLVGSSTGVAVPHAGIPPENLPDLTLNMTWVGDSENHAIERLYVGVSPFLIREPNVNLPNAQNLKALGTGLLKIVTDGYLAIAIANTDYATTNALESIKDTITDLATTAAGQALLILNSARAALISAQAAEDEFELAKRDADTAQNFVEYITTNGLYVVPNDGDVNIQGYRVMNLQQSPDGDFDAISFTFLWDLMHDNVQILFP